MFWDPNPLIRKGSNASMGSGSGGSRELLRRQSSNASSGSGGGSSRSSGKADGRLPLFKVDSKGQLLEWLNSNEFEQSNQPVLEQAANDSPAVFDALKLIKENFLKEQAEQSEQDIKAQTFRITKEWLECWEDKKWRNSFTAYPFKTNEERRVWMLVCPLEVELDWEYASHIKIPSLCDKIRVFLFNSDTKEICYDCTAEHHGLSNDPGFKLFTADPQLLSLQWHLLDIIHKIGHIAEFTRPEFFDFINNYGALKYEDQMLNFFDKIDNDELKSKKRYCYNYMLLDERKFDGKRKENVNFCDFVKAIFYIGKATEQKGTEYEERPFTHLVNTCELDKQSIKTNHGRSHKKSVIREIWDDGHGVIVLSLFKNITEEEANLREATMIFSRMTVAFLSKYACSANDMKSSSYYSKIILGPMDIVNKMNEMPGIRVKRNYQSLRDAVPILKIGLNREENRKNDDKIRGLGCLLLLRAFIIFKVERFQPQYEKGIKELYQKKLVREGRVPVPPLSSATYQSSPGSSRPLKRTYSHNT